jgi:hypothetical protein
MDVSFAWILNAIKGGRHAQTRLSIHGAADVVPAVFYSLGRHSSLPALGRLEEFLE